MSKRSRDLPEIDLAIAGDGPERPRIEALARRLGLADRVRLLGRLPQESLPGIYGAADLLVHPSLREGWPNVLLESMACGTPVLATNFDSVGEIVGAPEAGRIVAEATPTGLADAIGELLAAPPRREATRRYAEGFDWQVTTAGQIELFRDICNPGETAAPASGAAPRTVEPRPTDPFAMRLLIAKSRPTRERSAPAARRRPAPRSSRPRAPAVHGETIARRARFRPRRRSCGIGTSRLVPSEIVIGRSVVSRTVRHGMPR